MVVAGFGGFEEGGGVEVGPGDEGLFISDSPSTGLNISELYGKAEEEKVISY